MKASVTCRDAQQAHKVLNAVLWPQVKSWLVCGGGALVVSVKPETRRDGQSRHFHSLIGQIATQLGGELSDSEDAKRVLISAFRIDTRNDVDLAHEWAKFGDVRMGRGLRGEVVLLGIQSRQFSVRLGAAFVDWLYAFGAEADVRFKVCGDEPKRGRA